MNASPTLRQSEPTPDALARAVENHLAAEELVVRARGQQAVLQWLRKMALDQMVEHFRLTREAATAALEEYVREEGGSEKDALLEVVRAQRLLIARGEADDVGRSLQEEAA